jgi:hypothetical protein
VLVPGAGLGSPRAAVVGATDLDAASRAYAAFGFQPLRERMLDAAAARAAYGVDGPVVERELGVPGAGSGRLLLARCQARGVEQGPYDVGPHAVDLYTRSADATLEAAAAAGLRVAADATVTLGPLVMRQVALAAPDATLLVAIEANRRRPSVLDTDPARVHSEVHSMLWAVDSIDVALPFWRDEAGLELGLDVPLAGPDVAALMGLPDDDAKLRMVLLSDQALTPSRFELLEHVGRSGAPVPSWPLRGGLHAPQFAVDDVEAAAAAMPSARFGTLAETGTPGGWQRALHGEAPGGVHFVLVEPG